MCLNIYQNTRNFKTKIVIRQSGKGKSLVIVEIEKMENFLSDQSKFQKTAVKEDNFFNFITCQEKRIDKIFKKLVCSKGMSEETQRHLKPVRTKPGIIYGSCKVHKKCFNGGPSFSSWFEKK